MQHRLLPVPSGHRDYFQQLHDVRRAEKVQAEDLLWAASHRGDGVDVQRRRITRQTASRFEQAVQFVKMACLSSKVS